MKTKLLYPVFSAVFFFVSFLLSSCTEEQSVHEPFEYVPSTHSAYILCNGTDVNPVNSFISFYNVKNGEFSQNIYSNHVLPRYPDAITFADNCLFVSIDVQFGKLIKTDLKGNYLNERELTEKPNRIYSYNDKIITTSIPIFPNENTLKILNATDMLEYYSNQNIHQYISDVCFLNNKLYVLLSRYNAVNIDSSLVAIQPPGQDILGRLVLRDKPEAMTLNNENKLVIACAGSSKMFYLVDAGNMVKIDSAAAPVVFSKCLSADKNGPAVYYVSEGEKIVKLNITNKTFTNIIFNTVAGYSISGYVYDSFVKKHFVTISPTNTYLNGMLKVYNEDGALQETYTTGKSPGRIIIVRKL